MRIRQCKKILSCGLMAMLLFALTACGQQTSQSQASSQSQPAQESINNVESQPSPISEESESSSSQEGFLSSSSSEESFEPEEEENEAGKTLVVYFSATGNTEAVAETIAETLGAELYELIPQSPYTDADLDWREPGSRVNAEHEDPNFRTVIAGDAKDLSSYDTILIGYPLWWREAPSIVWNFVESSDLAGKTMIPFCTSMSDGFGSSGETLATMAPDATWMPGERFDESADAAGVIQWVGGLDIAA